MGLKAGDLVTVVGNTEPTHYITHGATCKVTRVDHPYIDITGQSKNSSQNP